MTLHQSEIKELELSCGSVAAAFAKNGGLRFQLGMAHKGWRAEDVNGLIKVLSDVLAGTRATAEGVFLRRTECVRFSER